MKYEKIKLPIEENKKDKIKPLNPDFSRLLKILIITIPTIIFIYLCFYLFAYLVVWKISIEDEEKYLWNFWIDEISAEKFDVTKLKNKPKEFETYNIYVNNSDEINAYAFLWWKIIITQWLLDSIEHEEELLFIIWHEMEHIKNRDVLRALLVEIPFQLSLNYLWIDIWTNIINISDITTNYISKDTELKADKWWIELINSMWLNLNCSSIFFKRESDDFSKYIQFASTHPSNIKRIKNIEKQNKNKNKDCTPLKR